jgi:TonB family protein
MSSPKVSSPKIESSKIANPRRYNVREIPLNRAPSKPLGATAPITEKRAGEDPRQHGLMVGSLCLLLVALSIVLWHDRDFWFPDAADDADTDQPVESAPAAKAAAPLTNPAASANRAAATGHSAVILPAPTLPSGATLRHRKRPFLAQSKHEKRDTPAFPKGVSAPAAAAPTVARTVLPPLQVEVVAGDSHRLVRAGNDSVRVDLRPGTVPQPAPERSDTVTAASVTSNAVERVQMSADTSAMVSSPVRPSYPLLARQMKVQGSVILRALIGRDGNIQDLRLVSGPGILAAAAEDAVRQWRFKPHYEGSEAVETQAKITVNFTISTN